MLPSPIRPIRLGNRPPPRKHVQQSDAFLLLDPQHIAIGIELIGTWVLDSRRRLDMTQMQLERMSAVDQTTISRLERGRLQGITLKRLAAIVGALALASER
jgi:DNA-binding Xre family transcriptional regulator